MNSLYPDVDCFAKGFLNQTLPKDLFDHLGHVKIAIWHLKRYSFEETICRVRAAIILFNHVNGGENTGERGYHETITIFWLKVVQSFMKELRELTEDEVYNKFVATRLADRDFIYKFYEKQFVASVYARAYYVAPLDEYNLLR
ncbi:hypothetical protein KK083_14155 [Fulvivirgaceae bacterium PWU4]|uniref:Uncharacterized protein n=1 Tax=Chryseosolibacter histidini TaxID=2782349 RepID=A0AAP2GJ71_9BACT|nr:hypothetical protein [Chryseosolibacter histidini]MBT1698031.1 hypothetical protein [Chryseosolibacter histidini]